MKPTDLSKYLADFLGKYLTGECGLSQATVTSYSYSFELLIRYMKDIEKISACHLTISEITKERIIAFLNWLEEKRNCSASTRNARLGAIHSFFSYLQYKNVAHMEKCQEILSIKTKKTAKPSICHLETEGIKLLMSLPDQETKVGYRDFILMGLLFDSGSRVQELINLTYSSFSFGNEPTVSLHGKGNKARVIPLSKTQVANLRSYLLKKGFDKPQNRCKPIFPNPKGECLTRMAVLNIIKKYADRARAIAPELIPEKVGCHTFRHSKAMSFLDGDHPVPLVYIRDFLGHVSTKTTEIYARASSKLKVKAMASIDPTIISEGKSTWQQDADLLEYLKSLRTKY